MRAVFLIAALGLLPQFVQAQDTIQRVDGTIQLARIIETTPSMVRYIPIENPDGPIFSITKQAISKIVFEDGTGIFYRRLDDPHESSKLTPPERSFLRNIFSLNLYDLSGGIIAISYIRISQSGTFGFKIPLSIGLFNPGIRKELISDYARSKIYSTGIGLNYYPYKQEQVTWYLGLSVCGGQNKMEHQLFQKTIWEGGVYTGVFIGVLKNFELSSQFGISLHSGPSTGRIRFPIEISICLKL